MKQKNKKLIIVAGMDPSGNAGLVRDLEVANSLNLKASCIVTALTSQNNNKFISPQIVSETVFKNQLKALFPLKEASVIKIGMLGNKKNIRLLVKSLKKEKTKLQIVLDPLYQSSTGGLLLTAKGKQALLKELLPFVTLWTPNVSEAQNYSGLKISSLQDMGKVGLFLFKKFKVPVLIKGGIFKEGYIVDLFISNKGEKELLIYPLRNRKTIRGTGCTLASFIASNLALNLSLDKAISKARLQMDEWFQKQLN